MASACEHGGGGDGSPHSFGLATRATFFGSIRSEP